MAGKNPILFMAPGTTVSIKMEKVKPFRERKPRQKTFDLRPVCVCRYCGGEIVQRDHSSQWFHVSPVIDRGMCPHPFSPLPRLPE